LQTLLLSPQIEQSFTNTPIGVPAREKKLLGNVRGYNDASKTKTAKVLEASNLRAFYKLHIIGNKQLINLIAELMYCYGLGSAPVYLRRAELLISDNG